jgi:hypothetical protein
MPSEPFLLILLLILPDTTWLHSQHGKDSRQTKQTEHLQQSF